MNIKVDDQFRRFFNEKGPYYTSYPTRGEWKHLFNGIQYQESLVEFFKSPEGKKPIHLYLHIPYCAKLCYYCICNIQVTNDRQKMQKFVDILLSEMNMLASFFENHAIMPNIKEIHLGGGTPSHLDQPQIKSIVDGLKRFVDFNSLDEFAMEIDPRTANQEDLAYYASLGVERISFGVQDFDPTVQKAINRIQPRELVAELIGGPVRKYFKSLNFDLLYGLPFQTRETFKKTVEITNELRPDRVTLLKFAHVPEVRKHMRIIKKEDLPDDQLLPDMFADAIDGLTSGGYDWIGIDNFALPTDDLAQAHKSGTVGRNFGGFTPGRTEHLIGLGPSTTSNFGRFYCQTTSHTEEYMALVSKGEFPITSGYVLSPDDLIRRDAIFSLMCHLRLDLNNLSNKWNINAHQYFQDEIDSLKKDIFPRGMIEVDQQGISITQTGRYFVRNICKIFDVFHRNKDYKICGP